MTRTFFLLSPQIKRIFPQPEGPLSKAELQEVLKRRVETHQFLLCSSLCSCSLTLACTACAPALQRFLSHKDIQSLLEMQTSSSLSLLKGSETEGRHSATRRSLSPGRRLLRFGTVRAVVMQDRLQRPQGCESVKRMKPLAQQGFKDFVVRVCLGSSLPFKGNVKLCS